MTNERGNCLSGVRCAGNRGIDEEELIKGSNDACLSY